MSGTTAQDSSWKAREQAAETEYARSKEREQLESIRAELANTGTNCAEVESVTEPQVQAQDQDQAEPAKSESKVGELERDFEGGFGGQEDLEDRYATTLGEH